jgi:TRAP-type C4-dicarboxylate transport system permease large subunit
VLGTLPFVFMMTAAIVLLCVFPQIATFAPDLVYNK